MRVKNYSDRFVLVIGKKRFGFVKYEKYWIKPTLHNYFYILPSIMYENDYDNGYIRINWLRFRFTIEVTDNLMI